MGVEIPLNFGQASIVWSCNGVSDHLICTIGYQFDAAGGGPPVDPMVHATAFRTALANPGKLMTNANLSNQYTFLGIDCQATTATGTVVAELRDPSIGTATFSPPPANCAVLVKKNSATGGRTGRGRMFFPAGYVDESQTSAAGVVNGIAIAAIQSGFNTWLADMDTANLPLYLLHSDPARAPSRILSFSVNTLLATQRRRMR